MDEGWHMIDAIGLSKRILGRSPSKLSMLLEASYLLSYTHKASREQGSDDIFPLWSLAHTGIL